MIERCVMLWIKIQKHRTTEAVKMHPNHDGGSLYRQQEQLRKKAVKEITLDDISKGDFPKSKLKQVVKHQMQKADWWEQQAKQNEQAEKADNNNNTGTKQEENDDKDKDKIIKDLKKEYASSNETVEFVRKLFLTVNNLQRFTDEEVGHLIRFLKNRQDRQIPLPKSKPKPKPKPQSKLAKMGKENEKTNMFLKGL